MNKKIISVFLALTAVIMIFCSCGKQNEEEKDAVYKDKGNAKTVEISLPYSSGDSFNPYFANSSENLALSYIYCQPLFTVKSNYECEPVIASDISVNDKRAVVSLNEVMFSDGSVVSAQDIAYSFSLAKKSFAFSQRLKNVDSVSASGSSVTFNLKAQDKLAANALTFPIVKSGTADNKDSVPIGSGVFKFNGKEELVINQYSQKISSINTVKLSDIKTPELAVSELEIGNINYLFEDFSEGKFKAIVSQSKNVTLNNLVFLGINAKDGALSSQALRTAIYYAIDKENASAAPYQGYAVAAATPFNPDFYELQNISLPDVKGDKDKARSIIEKLGYSSGTKNGVKSVSDNRLNLSLTVNKDNAFRLAAANKIADELSECGFKISVIKLGTEEYKKRVNEGNYQLCIGEIKLTENMDLSAFSDGFYKKCLAGNVNFFKDYENYKAGKKDINTVINSFLNDAPFIPICYRVGVAAYTKLYSPDFTYAPFDIYGNIENWEASQESQ